MRSLLAVLAFLSLPTLAASQTVCGAPVTRFLDLVSVKTLRSSTIQNLHTFGTKFVFADGSYLASAINGVSFRQGPIGGTRGGITRGTSSAAFADLRRAANEARVGTQTGCRIVRLGGEESYHINWYGKNGRTNFFVVTSEAGPPECPPEVVAFVDLLLGYSGSPVERFTTP